MLTFAAFWYAAARLRSRLVALAAAGYTAATVLEFIWAGPVGGRPVEPGFSVMIALTLLVGTGHLIAIRPRLSRAVAVTPPPAPVGGVTEQDPAYCEAIQRRTRRAEARA
jgi:hypothetical protein